MPFRSNIGLSLNSKRRKNFFFKLLSFLAFLFVLFIFISICSYYPDFRIKDISVSGNSTVSSEEIVNIVKNILSKKYLFVLNRDNQIFLPRFGIEETLLDNLKKIESIRVGISGVQGINIYVVERSVFALWCDGGSITSNDCYFIDKNGIIFSDAPIFFGNPFPKYLGGHSGTNIIGTNFLDERVFTELSSLFKGIYNLNINPVGVLSLPEGEYEIYLFDGGKININDKQDFNVSLRNLKALIDSGDIKTDKTFLSKIKHIDLRYGNKVHYDFK
ncbi:MAG: hypothetical protein WC631_01555 [Candidatus Paceibacterota bacterium]|jgi:hypothetical protein